MNNKNYLGAAGAALVFAGGLSPMLKLPIIGRWNYWDIEPVLASIVFLFATLALFASLTGKAKLQRVSGWVILVVVLFTLVAVHFKVNDSFSFIPFKKLASAATRLVKYQWTGWIMLIGGSAAIILASKSAQSAGVKTTSSTGPSA